MSSLGEEFPKEQARVREILGYYRAIGPCGAFGAMMIEQTLQRADAAVMSGDVVAMLAAYQEMREVQS